ncbi:phage tail tape measure protein [Marinibacterium profundimaris]|uniref:Tail protein n=1 Tax=Marinibacterium profundimaris TaxID=1679460 RepID=A0A225NRN6_9RHOB|nr:phage tail tape measure protein [Marinibacterium profundimaris]OWU77512.1 tail protein [Marinibacterium profundimaris]
MADLDGIEALDDQADALGDSLSNAAGMAASFDSELRRVNAAFAATGAGIAGLERGLSKGLRRAFDGVIFDGKNLSDAMNTLAQSMIRTTYSAAMKPVTDHFGGMLASSVGGLVSAALPFAKGGAFSGGRVTPFANGGVVNGPTGFPMRGGMGLMGEAGPEAIMPLARGPDGKLGVRGAGGGGPVNVVMNIQTPDVQGFQRSQGQIASQLSRALGRGNRNR